jgi:predicted secreted protein
MKKILILSLALALLALPGFAQEYTKSLSDKQQLKIMLNRSDMKIEGYSGNEVKITALDYEQPPERANGLRPLYNNAQDNTNIGLQVTEEGDALTIREASNKGGEYLLKVPNNIRLSIMQLNWTGSDVTVRDMKSEIEVQAKNADISLLNIQGPVIANSTNGDITIVYSSLSQEAPSMISAVSSEIDITLPATSKANLVLKSMTGEIYTDMDIKMKQKNVKGSEMHVVGGGQTIEGSTNGGGAELGISTISSNIYIRKAQ